MKQEKYSQNAGDGLLSASVPANFENYDVIRTAVDVNPAEPYKTYLVDSSTGVRTITIPDVTPGDKRWYRVTLNDNGNHCTVTTVGGVQLLRIGGQALQSIDIPTENTSVLIIANGVDGYDAILDSRVYDRVVNVTGDVDLQNGYESGGVYVANLVTSQIAIITIKEPALEDLGFFVAFVKNVGENASLRVKTLSGSFDETINENGTGITISVLKDINGDAVYGVKQDSRPKSANVALNFLPTDNVSVFEPSYGVLETESQPEEFIQSSAITSIDPENPNSLGFWINDNKALIGDLAETPITADAQIRLISAYNRSVNIGFRYYQYDFDTLSLNPVPVSETSYSAPIASTTFQQRIVSGNLPALSWAKDDLTSNNVLVIELVAIKDAGGGDNPIIEFRSGGNVPSKTTINVPVSAVNHATIGGVVEARTGVPDGHIDNSKPLQLPELTTAERDLVTANPGMEIWNTTTGSKQIYDGVSWKTVTIV